VSQNKAGVYMKVPEHGPADTLVDIELDEEQIARVDELIEQHSTPSHRLTREEIVEMLLGKGRELVAQGESLLPFLAPTLARPTDENVPSSTLGAGDKTTH
jgi:hypothetical protein